MTLPVTIQDEAQLDELLSRPTPDVVALMRQLDCDLIILGIGGKMGVTLGQLAVRAMREAGVARRVTGVSRFSDIKARDNLEACGVKTLACDLLDPEAVAALPQAPAVIYMAGRKFGTGADAALTWASNVIAPGNAARHFRDSRIVVFSTGCVYPLVSADTGGSTEREEPEPVGEYAQSCLGRERVFDHYSRTNGTPVCLLRLNYAVDLRYGVLHDIARSVYEGRAVDLSASHFNVIWQGDANRQALRCLEQCTSPAAAINVTGPETVSTRWAAEQFAAHFGLEPQFSGSEQGARMYLSNASHAGGLFGPPQVPLAIMIRWQAEWIAAGGRSLGKPTHFEVTDGKF